MSVTRFISFIATVVLAFALVQASDPDPLQDFCVAVNDTKAAVFVNGKVCKDPQTVTAEDFYLSGFNKMGNISAPVGTKVARAFINQLPGINTLGVALSRIDFAHKGLNPPHEHPRASEILHVAKGKLYAGFITSNPTNPNTRNKLYAKILNAGDLFVFPRGLIHFQYNIGKGNAVAFATFNSQDPGVMTIANAVFGSEPPVRPDVLARAFQLEEEVVDYLQSRPWMGNV